MKLENTFRSVKRRWPCSVEVAPDTVLSWWLGVLWGWRKAWASTSGTGMFRTTHSPWYFCLRGGYRDFQGRTQASAHELREKNPPLGYFKMWISCTFDCDIWSWPFSELGHLMGRSWSGISVVHPLRFIQGRIKYIGQGNIGKFQYCVTSGLGVKDICFQDLESVGIRSKLDRLFSTATKRSGSQYTPLSPAKMQMFSSPSTHKSDFSPKLNLGSCNFFLVHTKRGYISQMALSVKEASFVFQEDFC